MFSTYREFRNKNILRHFFQTKIIRYTKSNVSAIIIANARGAESGGNRNSLPENKSQFVSNSSK